MSCGLLFSVLCHLRRRHRRPKRSIWGICQALLLDHLGLVDPCRQELRLCLGIQLDLVGLWVLGHQECHHYRVVRVDHLGRVVHQGLLDQGRQGSLECLRLEHQVHHVVRHHLDCQVGQVGLVGQGRRVDRPFLRCQVVLVGQDFRVVLVGLVHQVCLVGMVGMVEA